MTTEIQLPATMGAVVIQEVRVFRASGHRRPYRATPQTKTVAVEEKPVPEVGDNELLVKVEYVAVNPTDWKRMSHRFMSGETAPSDAQFGQTSSSSPVSFHVIAPADMIDHKTLC